MPLPSFYDPNKVADVYRVDYAEIAKIAEQEANEGRIRPALEDEVKTSLILIDEQNTFCTPGFELFVGGRSGSAAVADSTRLCEFIYKNLLKITDITVTMDTHHAAQVFHPKFFINNEGQHPQAYTDISLEELTSRKWYFNPRLAGAFNITAEQGQAQVMDYAEQLRAKGKFALTIWPYHAMLGGIGHALVSAIEEAAFYHSMLRDSNLTIQTKGDAAFTENYSALAPEVLVGVDGKQIGVENDTVFNKLLTCDRMVIAGQAKSHCVAWTISDLLEKINKTDPRLAKKIYLLEDCASPVVIPGAIDFTESADAAYRNFAAAGMHIVHSTDPIEKWND